MDIKEKAIQLIYQSPIINYFNIEEIEKGLENIYIITDYGEFKDKYFKATGERYCGILEGFQNSSGIYIGPQASPHTIIHELLHDLSSKFDENNHRTLNGIMGKSQNQSKIYFGLILNEGLTDYLAAKISHEEPRHYINGHHLFSNLESSMVDYFEDPEILFSIYFNNNVELFKEFLDTTVRKGAGQLLYEKFNFMDNDEIKKLAQIVNSSVKKSVRFRKIKRALNKFKNFFR